MRCKQCTKKAVIQHLAYCKEHFIAYVEKTVKETIKKYALVQHHDLLAVGVSGGKDSLTILYLLKKWKYHVTALVIDEGIQGYREITLEDMKAFCTKYHVPYTILSYKQEFKKTLDEALPILSEKPCTVCGTFRRYLLNKGARQLNATKLVTGHNLDDEAQAILMNFLKNKIDLLARQGPRTGLIEDPLFIPRIKPLFFLTEKEVALYAFFKGFVSTYVECPNAHEAFRADVGAFLNTLEQKHSGTKQQLIKRFLRDLPLIKNACRNQSLPQHCVQCGEPSHKKLCKACELSSRLLSITTKTTK